MSDARDDALSRTSTRDVVGWWSTAISDIEPGIIRLRGYPVEQLIDGVGFVEMIWLMVRGDLPARGQASLLEKALVSAVDHGPQAPSIAAARMAATCGVGLHGAISTGVGLLGDDHGGAGQQCVEVLDGIRRATLEGAGLGQAVQRSLDEFASDRRYVPGFGHRFHPRDPRRDPLLAAVRRHVELGTVTGEHLVVAEEIERQLAQRHDRPVPMNIDGATAVIYAELGFAPELARGLFILSRSVGILAHAWEEREGGRRIKGPLPPPLLAAYTGPGARAVPRRENADHRAG
ncbi:citrate synthase family protein [Rhodococcus sp. MTM3W5.2]|uniref:citryl-CoA lyase n=1 Tax=Rhodococcus sp. MTM3W5.2 TaxID=1805827 RepID=UPI0009790B7E|nr:citryl-CoA lyase [Rhodococcus sp. MTM3W5.2]AQA24696.1 citrate synthase family protein [Rhodococcus sp. MTM3W5.2]